VSPQLLIAFAAFIAWFVLFAPRFRGLWQTSTLLNRTDDWTPLRQEGQEPAPIATPLIDWFRRAITPHLEVGETLEGLANGYFSPPRRRDWGNQMGLAAHPLLMAVTPRRILLFELGYRTVERYCFIHYEVIQFLIPPKEGVMGTSGNLRFGLKSGREYCAGLRGPLFNDQGMREEQRLAAYLRTIAPRFASSPAPRSLAA